MNDTATKDKERMPKSKGKVEPMMERIFEAILGGLGIMVLDFVETVVTFRGAGNAQRVPRDSKRWPKLT